MKQEFTPRIDRKVFKEIIFRIQDNEGNNSNVVNTIAEKIKNTQEIYFFDVFINICNQYNVSYRSYKETEAKNNIYEVIIIVNNRDHLSITYDDINYDVSKDLASKLYDAVGTQIRNEEFINSVKR
ncbi:hypothetical protein [Lacinutrix salivirga]